MLVDDLPPFLEDLAPLPDGSYGLVHYHLTINRTDHDNWSAGYMHFATGKVMLPINDAEDMKEIAVRLGARLKRYNRNNRPEPSTD